MSPAAQGEAAAEADRSALRPGVAAAPVAPATAADGPVWSWLVPLIGGLGVFSAVLASTPPGFGAFGDVLFGIPRGPFAAATAYALGAAGTLGLLTLLALTGVCYVVQRALRHQD